MKILIVEDEKTTQIIIKNQLEKSGYEVKVCSEGAQAIELSKKERFDLVSMDMMLPDMNGITTAKKIKEIEINKFTPILFFSGTEDLELRRQAFDMGIIDFFNKNFERDEFIMTINSILKPQEAFKGFTVLLVEDDKFNLKLINYSISKLGVDVITATDGLEALKIVEKNREKIDMIISDYKLPLLSGTELLKEVRGSLGLRQLPFIAMTADSSVKTEEEFLSLRVTDFFPIPFIQEIFLKRIESYLLHYKLLKKFKGDYELLKKQFDIDLK